MNTTITLSKKGLKELKKSITKLEKELASTRAGLKDMDKDLSREGQLERVEAVAVLQAIELELLEKRSLLKNSRLATKKPNPVKIAIGSVVELIDRHGKKLKITIVESVEANPLDGRVSIKSPLGMELLGRTIKETIEFTTRKGQQKLQILAIH